MNQWDLKMEDAQSKSSHFIQVWQDCRKCPKYNFKLDIEDLTKAVWHSMAVWTQLNTYILMSPSTLSKCTFFFYSRDE